jgi:hypothetical protein
MDYLSINLEISGIGLMLWSSAVVVAITQATPEISVMERFLWSLDRQRKI